MDFPRTVEEITPEWLTSVLRESGAIQDGTVQSFIARRFDQGFVGEVNRLDLTYKDGSAAWPASLISKTSLRDDERRIYANSLGIYDREVRFYNDLALISSVRLARRYFADFDEESGYSILLLEDLGHLRSRAQADGCNFEDASAAVELLARLHAAWWEDERLLHYDWLNDYASAKDSEAIRIRMVEIRKPFLEIASQYLPPEIEGIVNQFIPKIGVIRDQLSHGPLTLTHGDFKLANLFFDDSTAGPDSVVTVDWQRVGRSRAAVDIAIFIATAFDAEVRRQYENDLLAAYHKSLVRHGVEGYSWDDFIRDFRLGLLALLATQVNTVGSLVSGDPDLDKRRHAMICERIKPIFDWDCVELIPK